MTRTDHIRGAFSITQIDILLEAMQNLPEKAKDSSEQIEQKYAIELLQMAKQS